MSRPDLDTSEGVAAYRRELAGVARPLRYAGVAFALLGVGLALLRAVAAPDLPAPVPLAALALGLLNLLAAAALRSHYHRSRLQEPGGPE